MHPSAAQPEGGGDRALADALGGGPSARLCGRALELASSGAYRSLGTFEFLMDAGSGEMFFIEANPRIQVEHTVTEEVFGLDLVRLQLEIAGGARLAALGVEGPAAPRLRGAGPGQHGADGREGGGAAHGRGDLGLRAALGAGGAGGRVRVCGLPDVGCVRFPAGEGGRARPEGFEAAAAKAGRALAEFRIEGLETNAPWLRAPAGARGGAGEPGDHALHRGPCGGAGRGRGGVPAGSGGRRRGRGRAVRRRRFRRGRWRPARRCRRRWCPSRWPRERRCRRARRWPCWRP